MIDLHLAKAIADIAIFLEYTDRNLMNEDTAIEAMEQLASELQRMEINAQRDLSEKFFSCSSSYDGLQKNFVNSLPETFGLES